MTTLTEILRDFRARLAAGGVEDPAAEARILVGGLLKLERTDFITRGDMQIGAEDAQRLANAVARRLGGEPPYRILGHRAFHGLELELSEGTLEPRPDTEILVDTVLELLKGRQSEPLRLLDLGTGTGAICLALLSQLPNARGLGVDLSEDALATARRNAAANGLGNRFEAQASNWFEAICGTFDVIVSNPPYIRSDVIPTLDREVREFDPLLALDGGEDGLAAYRVIASGASAFLNEDGFVAVETGFDQRHAVRAIFEEKGFVEAVSRQDYGRNDRVQVFRSRI
ncbi:peptide chain release factor N(5)-glutamine methyltransferase [Rhizobium sp. KVB221]|uniref:Release factor glutamine methyltransferase n=1 Tax=Rhizobium setariae TaxID=2801340 RepID=A0A936YWK1_9HYPH|nr:peptide chain release factor N(5)-glutamine methyltransferase [Rhizobium setariae]MBL0374730.1 peptide chain release factor N(5)-glutamine methyltransferase [Rhizobium setariae]